MQLRVRVSVLILLCGGVQAEIHWKTRVPGAEVGRQPLSAPVRRLDLVHRHVLIEYPQAPQSADIGELQSRGAVIVQYVPQNSYIVSAPDWMSFAGLAIKHAGLIGAAEKVSPLLPPRETDNGQYSALVEFYNDVDMGSARSMVLETKLNIQENPDLAPNHLLVRGAQDQFTALSAFDEVAYIFPASRDLVRGRRGVSCGGAMTTQGAIGQEIAIVGGWAGGASSGANLLYAFQNATEQLPVADQQSEIARAFAIWAKYVQVNFIPSSNTTGDGTISVLFATGAHGDPYPFTSTVLAHTFYPYPDNPEPIAGDMHFNDAQTFQIGGTLDLFSVALHETGHALGLGHSDQPTAVMYPYYKKASDLTTEDITAILSLYPAASASSSTPLTLSVNYPGSTTGSSTLALGGTVKGGTGAIQVTWSTDHGSSGAAAVTSGVWLAAAIPLSSGSNTITVNASDSQQNKAAQVVPIVYQPAPTAVLSLAVNSPGSTTTAAALSLTGSVSGANGAAQISWTSDHGGSGAGTVNGSAWSVSGIELSTGANAITVTAKDSAQNQTSQTVAITLLQAPSAPSAPQLQIVSPAAGGTYNTDSSSVTISGTASDSSGIADVTWSATNGSIGITSGSTSWSVGPFPLAAGTTQFTFTAHAESGATSTQSISVNYTPPSTPSTPASPTGPDTTPPTLVILIPSSTSAMASSDTVAFSGTSSDNVGVTLVTWSTSNGDSGNATGTATWSAPSIPVYPGSNTVTITAYDAAGNSAWRSVVVTR